MFKVPRKGVVSTKVMVAPKRDPSVVKTVVDREEAVEVDLAGEGPWGMVGVTIPIKLSAGYNSVGMEFTIQMPVSKCRTLDRAEKALLMVKERLEKRVVEEIPNILETLKLLPRDR